MAVLGLISIFLIFFSVISWAVSGRKIYLSMLLWAIPIFKLVFNPASALEINGLVILISFVFSAETIYSITNIRLWNTEYRSKNNIFIIVSFIINTIISFYFSIESYSLGYMVFTDKFPYLGLYISILWGILSSISSSYIFINAFDKYFSKKTKFVLIKCSPSREVGFLKIRKKGIKGVQNGRTYIFRTTHKAYSLLKNQKSLVLNVHTGVLGGMYCNGKELFVNKNRQMKRINRILLRRGIFAFISVFVIILFFYRVLLGMDFTTIFALFTHIFVK